MNLHATECKQIADLCQPQQQNEQFLMREGRQISLTYEKNISTENVINF